MENLEPKNNKPDFGTLTGIMERFAQIPYEQFQQELHDWFYHSLSEKGIDLQQLQDKGLTHLPELVSAIYHEAEIKQLLNDQSISDEPHNDQA
ncbi:hypothetical protein [Mucilaginibacter myungsuensis]|uniref:Uncharacterized protein n=1 Tax=Mucilaginibacter myungsuensis TaxID=649104 RepID=A0A929PXF0_9SPHI|nr:hypothetical protein [Mucilaginibacter myungsuensis]MBE9663094.1 hypothetical protein [Mucilaginibacter myungsuensis]MDN3598729.1 hypothetical protein [Mucilaginibacter myungsuensis]